MNEAQLVFWLVVLLLGMALSFLYSGMEMGAYSLNRVRLQVLVHQHHRGAEALHRLLHDPATLLTTLLIGNNVANYLIATSSTVILQEQLRLQEWEIVLANVLVMTPVLFVLTETLPKDLFAGNADRWVYRLWRVLDVSRLSFTLAGLVPLVRLINRLLTRGSHSSAGAPDPRRQVHTLLREGVGRGVLTDEQSAMVERVLYFSETPLTEVMVPWKAVVTLQTTDAPARLWQLANQTPLSRFPALDKTGAVQGIISVYDVLLHEQAQCPPLAQFVTEALKLDVSTPLSSALTQLRGYRGVLAIVTDRGQPVGVVSVKDIVESITGDLASW